MTGQNYLKENQSYLQTLCLQPVYDSSSFILGEDVYNAAGKILFWFVENNIFPQITTTNLPGIKFEVLRDEHKYIVELWPDHEIFPEIGIMMQRETDECISRRFFDSVIDVK